MIVFENDGIIDVRAIKTFGVNSKDDAESAIGYFGTGLKYAIAILLRTGCSITIITGGKNYEFDVNKSKIRNDEFDIVTMNGEELGYTTQLGKDWEMWMAYREIMSNTLDEGGKAYVGFGDTDPNKTYVLVSGEEFEKCYANNDNYFLNKNRTPIASHCEVDVYEKETNTESPGNVFCRGVRVMVTRTDSLFDYNHKIGLKLTEDRTIKDSWSTLYHVGHAALESTDKAFIRKMVMAERDTYEGAIGFHKTGGNLDVFLDVVGELRKKYKDTRLNVSAIAMHKGLRKVATVMPGISCHLNNIQQQQFDKAVTFCKETLELELDDYQLIVCKDLGDTTELGRADIEKGIMYISRECFAQGTKRVAVALLEEYTHCRHEVLDETVKQKWIYLQQIMSLGERLTGEPL